MTANMKKLGRIVALAAVASGALVAANRPAHATATKQCKVNIVEYYQDTLLIQCVGGGNFFGQIAPEASCKAFAQNLDTLKIWLSMAQTALLAGKNVLMYYTSCGSQNTPLITVLDLDR